MNRSHRTHAFTAKPSEAHTNEVRQQRSSTGEVRQEQNHTVEDRHPRSHTNEVCHSERSEESQRTRTHEGIIQLPATKTSEAQTNEVRQQRSHTNEVRHPERSAAKSKDLHSFTPSTTLREPTNLGIARNAAIHSVENSTKYSEGQGFSPAVKAARNKRLQPLRGILLAALLTSTAHAQFSRTGPEWTTSAMDAQRSRSVPADVQITPETAKDFQLLWKVSVQNKGELSEPVQVNTFIAYTGFKALTVVGGTNALFSIDYDLGRAYFDKHFTTTAKACPTALAGPIGRLTPLVPPPITGTGRKGGYHSSVSTPGAGVNLSEVSRARPVAAPVPAPASTQTPAPANAPAPNGPAIGGASGPGGIPADNKPITGPVRTGPAPGTGLYKGSQPLFYVTTDGILHGISQGSFKELHKPTPFLPAGTGVASLIDVDDTIYASTANNCVPASNSVYAIDVSHPIVSGMDPNSPQPAPTKWQSATGPIIGIPAFTESGIVNVATPRAIAQLEPKTLTHRLDIPAPTGTTFASQPVIFRDESSKEQLAITTADGRIHVLSATAAAGTPDSTSAAEASFKPNALTTFENEGTRYLLAVDTNATTGTIHAYKLTGTALEPAWTSATINTPSAPIAISGVVFVLSKGSHKTNATLYALDAATGKPLWNSGTQITSPVTTSNLSFSPGQITFATADNTIYAFGLKVPAQ
ncbi:PQQ-binding-like beta-propeller repeat protein [Terriglobus sp. ADX1]|uniref:PQQ-binding-like beta-propeller repeat protein n=1 Tax=Terriglobus sp. ADX1 TaxID=2794063 RepID=UPI002FE5A3FD